MSSLKYGSIPRMGRPDERTQPPKAAKGAVTSRDSSQTRRPRQGTELPRPQIQDPVATNKIPSVPTAKRPPRLGHSRPPLTHQDKSWGSGSANTLGISSARSTSRTVTPLASPSGTPTEEPKKKTTRNVLRRRSSNTIQDAPVPRNEPRIEPTRTGSSSLVARSVMSPESFSSTLYDRNLTDSPADIRVAMQVELPTTNAQTVRIYPELDRYRDSRTEDSGTIVEVPYPLSTHDLPPPTPLFSGTSSQLSGYSGSPSTGFSGSPGLGPYSRDTTPTTSIPSQSPALVASQRFPGPRLKPISPAHPQQSSRPPVTRRRAGSISNEADASLVDPHGLAAVREALNSSSSNSTVREDDSKRVATGETEGEKKRKKKIGVVPPEPPPRKSSEKFRNGTREEETSPSKAAREPARPVMASRLERPPALTTKTQASSVISSPRATPPVRPSRDNTPDLLSQYDMPVVIQSNLSSTSLKERRQSLPLGPGYRAATISGNRSVTPTGQPSRPPQPAQAKPTIGREPTPAPRTVDTRRPSHGSAASRTPSPGIATFKTRFPLFGRRKTEGDVPQQAAEKKEKPVRKGPAAGTGHEGYGRVGMPHRRRSSLSRGISGTMSSQESLESRLSDDPFLLERMNPVVISGGSVVKNGNVGSDHSRGDSNHSLTTATATNSTTGSEVSLPSAGDRNTLWPSPFTRGLTAAPTLRNRRPSDSSDSEAPALAMTSTLAYRRSMQKLKDGADQSAVRMPKPILTRPPMDITSPTMTSHDTTIMSDDSVIEMTTGRVIQGPKALAATPPAPKKLTKRAKSPRKWNFFGRSTSQGQAVAKKEDPPVESRKVTATVRVVPSKQAAFYTMDMSEQEDNGDPALGAKEALRDARLLASPPKPQVQPQPRSTTQIPPMGRRSMIRRSVNGSEDVKRGGLVEPQVQSAQSKLPVGRRSSVIKSPTTTDEQVARRDDAETQLRSQKSPVTTTIRRPSVSRTASRSQEPRRGGVFEHVQPIQQQPREPPALEKPVVTSPEPAAATSVPAPAEQPATRRTGRPSRLPQVGRIPKVVSARAEKTPSQSFSRPFKRMSFQSPPAESTQDVNAVATGPSPPRPCTPDAAILLGKAIEASPSLDETTHLDSSTFRVSREPTPDVGRFLNEFLSFSPRKNSQSTSCTTSSSSSGLLSYAHATAVIPAPNAPLAEDEVWLEYDDILGDEGLKVPPSAGSSQGVPFHLEGYTGRLAKQAEPPVDSPTFSPLVATGVFETCTFDEDDAVSPVYDTHKEREKVPVASSIYSTEETDHVKEALKMGVIPISSALGISAPSPAQSEGQAFATTASARNTPRRPQPQQRASYASSCSQLSEDTSPLSQVNLRVGSMTVSKWLTFGHVLFSPVRDELVPVEGSLKRHSILVIDGLGNDDWSFYAAETYPEATFFNLSPRAPLRDNHKAGAAGSFPLSPPNHHQIQYKSHLDKLPFGAESFIAVVFRFPAAAPESHFRNIVAEARRVLKPGGFLELAILDLDLNNMGNRSRRVVRRLKERIHAAAPDTSLGSTADLLLRLMGRKGFVDVKSCRVGVPVASAAAAAAASSSGSSCSMTTTSRRKRRDDRSLAEMIKDDGPVADESITKMVAKVGRWWFSRCYETGLPAAGGQSSMWNDRLLLAECEEWCTSLKLMVCHARVPDGRTRVASI